MQLLYDWLGQLLFRNRQKWQQRQNAKILVYTVSFSLIFGLAMAAVIFMIYYHRKA